MRNQHFNSPCSDFPLPYILMSFDKLQRNINFLLRTSISDYSVEVVASKQSNIKFKVFFRCNKVFIVENYKMQNAIKRKMDIIYNPSTQDKHC